MFYSVLFCVSHFCYCGLNQNTPTAVSLILIMERIIKKVIFKKCLHFVTLQIACPEFLDADPFEIGASKQIQDHREYQLCVFSVICTQNLMLLAICIAKVS